MALNFTIDVDRRLIVVICTGKVTLREILQYETEVVSHEDFSPRFHELLDLSGATELDVSSDDITSIVMYEKNHEKYLGPRKCAFVAPADLNFALARMYDMMGGDSPIENQVFAIAPQRWRGSA